MDLPEIRKISNTSITKPGLRGIAARVQQLSNKQIVPLAALQTCFALDTTGSMFPVFEAARKAIVEVSNEINNLGSQVEMSFIAYKNHGDERHFNSERPFLPTPWTNDPREVQNIMNKVNSDGGGDGLTCLEDVLQYIGVDIPWNTNSAKAVIMIGDMPPHGVIDSINRCPHKIDYRRAVQDIKNLHIPIYSIYCDTDIKGFMKTDRKSEIKKFYEWIARETGGQLFSLEDIHLLITILTGICAKETNHIKEYENKLRLNNQLTPQKEQVIKALSSNSNKI